MPDSPGAGYRVSYLARALDQVRAWAPRARALGIQREYLAALRAIERHLATDPVGWGDPDFVLRQAGLRMCHGTEPPLLVYYAVDELRRIVYVKEFRPLPESGLQGGA